ncbi:fibrinogen-like protein 1 isoform X2 [Drosophila nasuta]|uniref:fibrinogen-like protein 1 isoform X2 n=1 Tax=Drosophila nasuta TaxID=42062 RepID=UPI00295E26DD|nr:fibrinogen-like protein 1 isoform X2 [Drosophila nasuta]
MDRIKFKGVLFLMVLQILLVATTTGDETYESDQKTVKPLLDIIRQLRNKLEQSETKEKQISELNSDLMEKYYEIVRIHETFMKEAALLNEYKNKVIKGDNDLQLCKNKVDKSESEINSQQNIILKLKEQLTDKSTNLENCQVQLKSVNSSLIEKDENIKRFSENIKNNTERQKTLELELEKSKSIIIKHEKDIQLCRSENNKLNRTSENIRKEQKKFQLKLTESETKLSQSELDKLNATTCLPFGDYSGVHQLNVSGIGLFNVLCDSQLAGPGWIVIQQRVREYENFTRDWATYRKGFGSFESDFFLGLEKIHRITSLQRFELYIHLVALNGRTYNARYDDFKISDEDNGYALNLGKFNGTNIDDDMRDSENMKFTTFDHDNDEDDNRNCAVWHESGWWYNDCDICLNTPYPFCWNFPSGQFIFLKEVKMLIRPTEEMKK